MLVLFLIIAYERQQYMSTLTICIIRKEVYLPALRPNQIALMVRIFGLYTLF